MWGLAQARSNYTISPMSFVGRVYPAGPFTTVISTAIALFPRGLGTRLAQLVDEDVKCAV